MIWKFYGEIPEMLTKLSQKFYRHRSFMRDLINANDPSLIYDDGYDGIVIVDHNIYGRWKYRKARKEIVGNISCDDVECINIKNYTQSTIPDDDWEKTMTPEEVDFLWDEIRKVLRDDEYDCADSFRGARLWKHSQRKRFKRLNTCCGSYEKIVKKFNNSTKQWDKYLIGFNYGH